MRYFGIVFLIAASQFAAAEPEVLREEHKFNGILVRQERFSVECPFYELSEEYPTNWGPLTKTYTLHVADLKALDKAGYASRVGFHGWYSWQSGKWRDFHNIDENVFWLYADKYHYLGELMMLWCYAGKCTRRAYKTAVALSDYSVGIKRDDLEVVESHGGLYCTEGDSQWSECRNYRRVAPRINIAAYPSDSRHCRLIGYKAPPTRLGF